MKVSSDMAHFCCLYKKNGFIRLNFNEMIEDS